MEESVGVKFYCPNALTDGNLKTKVRTFVHPTTALHPYTCTHHLTALRPGLPGWAGTRKAKPIWTLLKQETVNGSGISWATCKSALRSRQKTAPAPNHSVFYRPDALPDVQPTVSKHWRHPYITNGLNILVLWEEEPGKPGPIGCTC